MAVDLTADSGADVTIYRFRDFLGAGSAALILTRFDHLLTDEDREGWTGYGDAYGRPRAYPPAAMSLEDWYDVDGNPA